MTEIEAAVLDAARSWLLAKEAMLLADEVGADPAETERGLDQAEAGLTESVYRLLGRGPALP
jgi:hypothetical protein